MYNTIRLLKGNASYVKSEYNNFSEYDTILGIDSNPIEIKRWDIDNYKEARSELSKYKRSYIRHNEDNYDVTEYALEVFESDESGNFINGSDYEFAEREN